MSEPMPEEALIAQTCRTLITTAQNRAVQTLKTNPQSQQFLMFWGTHKTSIEDVAQSLSRQSMDYSQKKHNMQRFVDDRLAEWAFTGIDPGADGVLPDTASTLGSSCNLSLALSSTWSATAPSSVGSAFTTKWHALCYNSQRMTEVDISDLEPNPRFEELSDNISVPPPVTKHGLGKGLLKKPVVTKNPEKKHSTPPAKPSRSPPDGIEQGRTKEGLHAPNYSEFKATLRGTFDEVFACMVWNTGFMAKVLENRKFFTKTFCHNPTRRLWAACDVFRNMMLITSQFCERTQACINQFIVSKCVTTKWAESKPNYIMLMMAILGTVSTRKIRMKKTRDTIAAQGKPKSKRTTVTGILVKVNDLFSMFHCIQPDFNEPCLDGSVDRFKFQVPITNMKRVQMYTHVHRPTQEHYIFAFHSQHRSFTSKGSRKPEGSADKVREQLQRGV